MEKLMEINNLNLSFNGKKILSNISLTFFRGVNVFICGTSKSGKTSFFKEIKKKNSLIKTNVSYEVILENDELIDGLLTDIFNYKQLNIEEKEIITFLGLDDYLNTNTTNLDTEEKTKAILALKLIKRPTILFIDHILHFVSVKEQKRIINYIISNLKITLVYSSNDIEDSLWFPYMIVLDKGIIAIEGKTMQVLKEEKIMKRLGIGLPFIVDLSTQLKLYGLVDKVYDDKRKLVDDLWK